MTYLLLQGASVFSPESQALRPDTSILLEDGEIRDVGSSIEPGGDVRRLDVSGKTVVPGLIDLHHHFTFSHAWGSMGLQVLLEEPYLVMRSVRAAIRALRDGITTVREMGAKGGLNLPLKRAITAGAITGPRVLATGEPLGVPGGHAWMLTPQCSGEQEFAKAIRQNVRDGADWIKMFVSEEGFFGPPGSGPAERSRPYMTTAELVASVHTAHDMRTPVAVHANAADAIERSLDAGVDTIEHGIFLQPEQAARMAEAGTVLVPTLNVYRQLAEPRWGREELHQRLARGFHESHMQAAALAVEAGVPIGVGTDGLGGIAEDLELLTECGMSNAQALTAATLGNAKVLGIDDNVGRIQAGFVADLIVVAGDPTADLSVLRDIEYVVQGGDLRAPEEINLRIEDETPEWNTLQLAGRPTGGASPY